jgi:hypothetical protein
MYCNLIVITFAFYKVGRGPASRFGRIILAASTFGAHLRTPPFKKSLSSGFVVVDIIVDFLAVFLSSNLFLQLFT